MASDDAIDFRQPLLLICHASMLIDREWHGDSYAAALLILFFSFFAASAADFLRAISIFF